jgi:hypothetical protein
VLAPSRASPHDRRTDRRQLGEHAVLDDGLGGVPGKPLLLRVELAQESCRGAQFGGQLVAQLAPFSRRELAVLVVAVDARQQILRPLRVGRRVLTVGIEFGELGVGLLGKKAAGGVEVERSLGHEPPDRLSLCRQSSGISLPPAVRGRRRHVQAGRGLPERHPTLNRLAQR